MGFSRTIGHLRFIALRIRPTHAHTKHMWIGRGNKSETVHSAII